MTSHPAASVFANEMSQTAMHMTKTHGVKGPVKVTETINMVGADGTSTNEEEWQVRVWV